jgi:hypothetical protein
VFKGLLFLTFIDRIKVGKGFDYADVNVSYGGRADDPPRNFGGFSGGGLWLIELKGTTKEAVKMSRCTLYGVAFYQTKIVRSRRRIRCHWRRSIYDRLLRKIGKTVRARK